MNALEANIACQLSIIEVAGQLGWSDSLERDFIALGEAEASCSEIPNSSFLNL